MIKQTFRNLPLWARFWLSLIGITSIIAVVRLSLRHWLGFEPGEWALVGLLVPATIWVWRKEIWRKQKKATPHTRAKSSEKFTPVAGTINPGNDVPLDVATAKCPQCNKVFGAQEGDLVKNVQQLEKGGFAVKCPACGALSAIPQSQGRELMKKKEKREGLVLFASIMSFCALACVAGVVISAVIFFNPGVHGTFGRWFMRIAGACIFFACAIAALVSTLYLILTCKQLGRASDSAFIHGTKSKS
ncbi:MAG TPA: hypothetical protein VMG59_07660 [Phycisphaerae bacterium]|nr:hypothetical protein [Phycisphaerae bacterium]